MAGLTISAERETVVDFSYPFWDDSLGMITLTVPEDQFFLFKPLHGYVWLCYGLAALLAAGIMCVWEHTSYRQQGAKGRTIYMRLEECFWYTYSAMWTKGKFI